MRARNKDTRRARRAARRASTLALGAVAGLAAIILTFSCTNPLVDAVRALKAETVSPRLTLAVKGGEQVANGDTYDFGKASVTDPNGVRVTLVISNSGKTSMKVAGGSAPITGTDAANFSLPSGLPETVGAGDSMEFEIGFTPTTLFAKTAILTFTTNDVDNGTFSLSLAGVGFNQAPLPVFTGGNQQIWGTGIATVEITCSNSSATLYYTKDGSVPSLDAVGSTTFTYAGTFGFPFGTSGTIRAISQVSGMDDSDVATANFSNQPVPVPTLSVASTTFSSSAVLPELSISASGVSNALIAFTIDGTTAPNPNTLNPLVLDTSHGAPSVTDPGRTYWMANGGSFTYAGPHAGGTYTLRAIAFVVNNSAYFSSAEAAPGVYHFKMATPTFSTVQPRPPAQLHPYYPSPQSVSLMCDAGGSMKYTTDGGNPVSGAPYTVPITLTTAAGSSSDTVIKAIAQRDNWEDSEVLSGHFPVGGPGVWDASKWDESTWQ